MARRGDAMQTMSEFVEKHGIRNAKGFPEETDHNPNMKDQKWAATANHWICSLQNGKKSITVYFSQGSAITGPPSVEDVLNSLSLDSSGYDNARGDFDEWASEYGQEVDPDCKGLSRSRAEEYGIDCKSYFEAKDTFKVVKNQRDRLEKFLGAEAYQELLYETEPL